MKKKLFFIIQICTVLFAASGFYSCNDKIETGSDDRVRGVSIIPNPMTIGQPVSISGPNFKDATAIKFPGGVTVTNFTRTGEFQLNAIVPAGAAREGKITVSLPGGDFEIPFPVTIFSTGAAVAMAQDVNPETGNIRVGPNDELTIRGEGLGAIVEIILPGGLSISSMNFSKKTEASIVLTLPMGGFDRNAVEPLKMITQSGTVIYTVNKIEWSGEGYVPAELLPFCGRSFKVWTWDDLVDKPFGNGGYNSSKGPAWWMPDVNDQYGSVGHGRGAKMAFHLPNKMVLTLTNGTVYEGFFSVNMSKGVGTWSIGKLEITGGDDLLTAIGATRGKYNGTVEVTPKLYDIIKLTNAEMTLAFQYPEEPATANFYLYRVKEDEGEGSGGGAVTVPDALKVWVGNGSKTWTWNEDVDQYYGMGDALADEINWWTAPKDPGLFLSGEGPGASMVFSYGGKNILKLKKVKTDGGTAEGDFEADMSAKYPGWSRTIGKLTTKNVTVLTGKNTLGDAIFEYWILSLTDTKMVLGVIEDMGDDYKPDVEGWGQSCQWFFKAK